MLILVSASCNNAPHQKFSTEPAVSTIISGKERPTLTPPLNEHVHYYEPAVTSVTGYLCKKGVYSIENEDPKNGPDDSMVIIALADQIEVINPPGVDTNNWQDNGGNEHHVDTMQLVLYPYHSLDKYLGHKVTLRGTLFHADNGHHHTNVLMTVTHATDGMDSVVVEGIK
jgi:hypothetical protein